MATNIDLSGNDHKFQRIDLVVKTDDQGPYITYQCTKCMVSGKRRGRNEFITIYGKTKVTNKCAGSLMSNRGLDC